MKFVSHTGLIGVFVYSFFHLGLFIIRDGAPLLWYRIYSDQTDNTVEANTIPTDPLDTPQGSTLCYIKALS